MAWFTRRRPPGKLSSNLRELTGRGRYRAWAVI
ncbi:helix-turn-helix domain-containing protein [Methylosinus sp. PW1]